MHDTKGALGWLRLVLVGGTALAVLQAPACGGIMVDSTGNRDGGTPGFGGFGGGGGSIDIASGGNQTTSTCGNARIDPGEACDGHLFGGRTCATETMGTLPVGALSCAPNCQTVNPVGCRAASSGTGGVVGAGGYFGAGGYLGTGGIGSANACYDSGGVPGGVNGCAYGYIADEECMGQVSASRSTATCEQTCGCKACPGAYTRCMLDGACAWIFTCAQQIACTSVKDCYASGCAFIIDRAGGVGTVSARYADSAFSCLSQNGCPISCSNPPP